MKRQKINAPGRRDTRALAPLLIAAQGAVLLACTTHDLQAPNPRPEAIKGVNREVNPIRELDILFMIDDSGSMSQEQDNLKRNFKSFVDELRNIEGGIPDIHMAVISSNVGAGSISIPGNFACSRAGGDRGEFQTDSVCGLDPDARFIISRDNETVDNFADDKTLEEVFGCMASLGTEGCGYEHQLLSVVASLAPATTKNAGFLREDAYLAVILITDEDDCSGPADSTLYSDPGFPNQAPSLRCSLVGHRCSGQHPPRSEFQTTLDKCVADDAPEGLFPVKALADELRKAKPGAPKMIIVSAIMGWPVEATNDRIATTPYAIGINKDGDLDVAAACTSDDGEGFPGLRIKQFVESFGENGIIESICQREFTPALRRIAKLIGRILEQACVRGKLVDTDPNKPGVQGECSVTQIVAVGGMKKEEVIPSCESAGGKRPCFQLVAPGAPDNSCAEGWRVDVHRDQEPPGDTVERINCRTCVDIGGDSLAGCG